MITLSKQERRTSIVARQRKETDPLKEKRHAEFRKLVFKYELKSKWISEITGRNETTVLQWRMEEPTRVIPARPLEKVKEALGLPIE